MVLRAYWAKKKFDDDIEELQGGFDQTAEDISKARAEGEIDRKIDATLKSDSAAGIKLLGTLINQSKLAAAQSKAEARARAAYRRKQRTFEENGLLEGFVQIN